MPRIEQKRKLLKSWSYCSRGLLGHHDLQSGLARNQGEFVREPDGIRSVRLCFEGLRCQDEFHGQGSKGTRSFRYGQGLRFRHRISTEGIAPRPRAFHRGGKNPNGCRNRRRGMRRDPGGEKRILDCTRSSRPP